MLNISQVRYPGLNCSSSQVASIAASFGHSHELMFTEAWDFFLSPDNESDDILGNRIDLGKSKEYELLEKYHGIKPILNRPENIQELLRIIEEQQDKGLPTVTYIDSFWCRWEGQYQRTHHPHYCIAVDIDVEKTPLLQRCLVQLRAFFPSCRRFGERL